jgi:hypothetical protein
LRSPARANLAPGITVLSTRGFNPDFKTDAQKQKELYAQLNSLLVDEAFAVALAFASPRRCRM